MASRTLQDLRTLPVDRRGGPLQGGASGNGHRGDGFGWEGSGGGGEAARTLAARVGMWFLLAAVSMLFVAFTASYLARRSAPDWRAVPLPPVLWLNTVVLLATSVTVEWARRGARRGVVEAGAGQAPGEYMEAGAAQAPGDSVRRLRTGLTATAAGGLLFLAGQVMAWGELAGAGLFMATNPHSAFFYLLTGVHGVHLLGGIAALGLALWRAWWLPQRSGAVVEATAMYWHFLDALWLYVFAILFLV